MGKHRLAALLVSIGIMALGAGPAFARDFPGKPIRIIASPPGGANNLPAELFKVMAGVNLVRVNYRGASPALTALIGGEVHLMFATAIVRVFRQPEVRQRFPDTGTEVIASTPEKYAAATKTELATWGKVIREAGLAK